MSLKDDSVMEYLEESNDIDNEIIIPGIDLGTTNSCISIWRNNNCEIIPDEYGNKTIPSYVSFTSEERYIGEVAKNMSGQNPKKPPKMKQKEGRGLQLRSR